MRTPLSDQFGLDLALFAFNYQPDVVIEPPQHHVAVEQQPHSGPTACSADSSNSATRSGSDPTMSSP